MSPIPTRFKNLPPALCTTKNFFFPCGKLFPIVYEQLNSKCLTNHRFVRWKIFSSLHATNPNKIYKINCCRKQEEYKIKEICYTFSTAEHHWKITFCYHNCSHLHCCKLQAIYSLITVKTLLPYILDFTPAIEIIYFWDYRICFLKYSISMVDYLLFSGQLLQQPILL